MVSFSQVRSKLPILFLISIALFWLNYYQGNNSMNQFGKANFEWLYLIDVFISLPIICFLCIKNKKEALLKTLVLCCLAVFIGSYIIPVQNKFIWNYLESGRYFVLTFLLLLELIAIATVYLSIRVTINQQGDPDNAIIKPIQRMLGQSIYTKILSFETRMWAYAILAKKIKRTNFSGSHHFTYHLKDGAQSNLLGFILVIGLEIPLMHLFLHFIWSPLAANIITLLTVFSLIFFIAEYRAISRRPISLTNNTLIIRYGIFPAFTIPLSDIANISQNNVFVKRSKCIKRFNYAGIPNIAIELRVPQGKVKHIYIGVDTPDIFIKTIENKLV